MGLCEWGADMGGGLAGAGGEEIKMDLSYCTLRVVQMLCLHLLVPST